MAKYLGFDHIVRCQVFYDRRIALHKPFTAIIAQDAPFTASSLADQDAQFVNTGGVELDKLHILQGCAGPEGDGKTISRTGKGIGSGLINFTGASVSFSISQFKFEITDPSSGTWSLTGGPRSMEGPQGSLYGPNGEHIGGAWGMKKNSLTGSAGIFQGNKQ